MQLSGDYLPYRFYYENLVGGDDFSLKNRNAQNAMFLMPTAFLFIAKAPNEYASEMTFSQRTFKMFSDGGHNYN
jgi:hypothetical protein